MKYVFMVAHEEMFSVKRICHVLDVQRSGNYPWKRRPRSARELANIALLVKVSEAFAVSRNTYGSLRSQWDRMRRGYAYSRYRIGRLMKKDIFVPLEGR